MPATSLIIRGHGAVSSAGWSAVDLKAAVQEKRALPVVDVARTVGPRDWACHYHPVPPAPEGLLPKHPRLRRASVLSRYMLGAALGALGQGALPLGDRAQRLGIIVVVTNGCVVFTNRFFNEVIDTPALPSPILFPETVFNAPASHLAACLGVSGSVTSLVGEANLICDALLMAEDWLCAGQVDECLIIGAEEADWLTVEAATYYHPDWIGSEGAGALLVSLQGSGPRLTQVHGPYAYSTRQKRGVQLQQLASDLPDLPLWIDRCVGVPRLDAQEQAALPSSAARLSPMAILGDSLGASAALQLVLAAELNQHCGICIPGTGSAAYACVVEAG